MSLEKSQDILNYEASEQKAQLVAYVSSLFELAQALVIEGDCMELLGAMEFDLEQALAIVRLAIERRKKSSSRNSVV